MSAVLTIILTHQTTSAVARMMNYWQDYNAAENILIAYGGLKHEFELITHPHKVFIDDPRLRTQDHQRELQSYTSIFREAHRFLQERPLVEYVHFVEFDHLPLVRDLNQRQIARMRDENADVLGFHLNRVDDTNNAHFLYYIHRDEVVSYWQRTTSRSDPSVVLSMFGTGSFWSRQAFNAVAETEEPFQMYLELYLPTLAHHLGFRVRDFGEQDRFVQVSSDMTANIERTRSQGAWTLHPVKQLWNN